jgi:hypothetical protein
MMKKYFHERNERFLNDPEVNLTFEEILAMSSDQFRAWLSLVVERMLLCWDENATPPVVGLNEKEIIEQFNMMSQFDSSRLWDVDELTGEKNVIRNKFYYGSAVSQWFPTMFKASIKTSAKKDGQNIYDFFKDSSKFESFLKSATRNFKHDSFYHYSKSIIKGDKKRSSSEQPLADDPVEWITEFEKKYRGVVPFDYWLNPIKNQKEYSGFKKELFDAQYLWITNEELTKLYADGVACDLIDRMSFADTAHELFEIRFFKLKQKMFPLGMKVFRIAYGKQIAVNFPPLIARALYEKYTEHIVDKTQCITIYDPSSGWGGRILGAMSVRDDKFIHYVGTDPNTDHNTTTGRTKYHEVADFFNSKTSRSSFLSHSNTYEIFQDGSEVIRDNPDFQKYRGTVDLVFTSPPYFSKEVYSDDPEQSCHKFGSSYEAWRDGFLKPTLETCVEWLRSDRYLLWNVADPEFDGVRLPLEEDSRKILEALGMVYVETIKMALASMPGANRLLETDEYETFEENTLEGVVSRQEKVFTTYTKNSCKLNGRMVKYEPVFVFRKP